MKILFVTLTFPTPRQPNQGAFNKVLVDALRRRHDVRVLAPVPWTQLFNRLPQRQEWRANPSTDPTRPDNYFPIYFFPPKLLRKYYDRFLWASIRSGIFKLSRSFRPDVVLGYWLHPDGAVAVRAASYFGVPSIVISGGTDLRVLAKQPERGTEIAKVLQGAERVVLLSRELSQHAQQLGIAVSKIDIIYRGVDEGCFRPMDKQRARKACCLSADDVVVFWAGRLVPIKNPALLLQAAARWKEVWQSRLRVILAGEGPLRGELEWLRVSLGLKETVSFTGNLSQRELACYYNAANVTVLTSHSEGTPNVLLESIACGIPFVATDVGGVAEIATLGKDFLFGDNDLESLVSSVLQSVGQSETIVSPKDSKIPRDYVPTDMNAMVSRLELVINQAMNSYTLRKNAA